MGHSTLHSIDLSGDSGRNLKTLFSDGRWKSYPFHASQSFLRKPNQRAKNLLKYSEHCLNEATKKDDNDIEAIKLLEHGIEALELLTQNQKKEHGRKGNLMLSKSLRLLAARRLRHLSGVGRSRKEMIFSLRRAEKQLRRSNRIAKNNADTSALLGVVLHQLGDYKSAIRWQERVINRGYSDPLVHYAYADSLYQLVRQTKRNKRQWLWKVIKACEGTERRLQGKRNDPLSVAARTLRKQAVIDLHRVGLLRSMPENGRKLLRLAARIPTSEDDNEDGAILRLIEAYCHGLEPRTNEGSGRSPKGIFNKSEVANSLIGFYGRYLDK